jgi:high potential iron-sulfur protein
VHELHRRDLLRRGLQLLSAAIALPLAMRQARGADSCVAPASESLRSSLHYTDKAPDPAQACKACAFFASQEGKPACGNCMLMSGPVDATGHCDSWSAKG